jgi:hypothetical protein
MPQARILYIPEAVTNTLFDMPTVLRIIQKDFYRSAKGNVILPATWIQQVTFPDADGRHCFFPKLCALQDT